MAAGREAPKPTRIHWPRIAGSADPRWLPELHRRVMTVSSAPQQNSITTVGDRVRPVVIGTPVAAVYFIGDRAAFVGNEETITLVSADGDKVAATVHGGAILSSASDGTRIITGGDDGKVVALDIKGESS